MNKVIYEQVVRADLQHKAATQALSVIANEALTIEQRIREKLAARAQLVADVRTATLEEPTAALRLAILEQDMHDLKALLSEAEQRVAAAEARVAQTASAVRAATEALDAHERSVAIQALDRQILDLETKLLRALGERYRASGKRDESLWKLWSPSEGLRAAVTDYRLPKI
jgi:exonuclease VII large subunit